jgi:hypothetical protein
MEVETYITSQGLCTLSRERIEQIRAEVKAWNRGERSSDSPPQTVRMVLSCGHEDNVPAGLNPDKAICGQCRARSMRSTQG